MYGTIHLSPCPYKFLTRLIFRNGKFPLYFSTFHSTIPLKNKSRYKQYLNSHAPSFMWGISSKQQRFNLDCRVTHTVVFMIVTASDFIFAVDWGWKFSFNPVRSYCNIWQHRILMGCLRSVGWHQRQNTKLPELIPLQHSHSL